ncbi:hypothetical protein LshimejAT787_1501170 [Lyophyllum shimeji]|uniref:DUF6532 domain-containing protein n=1 Tax=Lyophyllum shimeji TaxID=47721 RepID=A0A9P3PXQ6_LYOSH|nr:hypothetical protein LshimejAT787_1501170 [Lyophyllum shimeji]
MADPFHDFSAKEPVVLGYSHRKSQPTACIKTFNLDIAKKAASRAQHQKTGAQATNVLSIAQTSFSQVPGHVLLTKTHSVVPPAPVGPESLQQMLQGMHASAVSPSLPLTAVLDSEITSTPVVLPSSRDPRLVRHTHSIPPTPSPSLIRRTHLVIPTWKEKECQAPHAATAVIPAKRSAVVSGDVCESEEDEDEAAASMDLDSSLPHKKKGLLVTETPYPTDQQSDQWAVSAWYTAHSELVKSHGYAGIAAPTENELGLIKMRLYQLRGQAKRDVAIPHFKLHHPLSPKVANANREVIATLKEHNEEPIERKNVYRNTVICDVITKLWYGEKQKSEAVLFPDYFKNGIPLVTIAFVSTSIKCTLDE